MQQKGINMNSDFLLYLLVLSLFNSALSPIVSFLGFFDEIIVLFIVVQILLRRNFDYTREVRLCILVFIFYLIHSLIQSNNLQTATFRDFIIFTKPFVCLYVAQYYGMDFSETVKQKCRRVVIFLGICIWLIAPFIDKIYYNTASYYPICAYTGMTYMILSNFRKKDWLIATLFFAPGLLSIRAKFFAVFVIWIYIVFYLKQRFKINIKYILISAVLLYIIYRINFDKIMMYTVNGLDEGAARTYLYYVSIDVLKDYFPFGPGFGTFATDSAGKIYSPLNYKYNLDIIWGLRPEDIMSGHNFYSDTFYPILAQFGIVGVILFVAFLKKRWDNINSLVNFELYKISFFLFLFLIIQCIAGNYFTSSDSLPVMLILGFLLSQKNNKMYRIK